MTKTENLPRVLPLKEIAERISAHLHAMEIDRDYNKVDPKYKTRQLYGAGAGVYGSKIGITYVSYQGHSLVTRAEALSYLAALDAGHRGDHFRWLEKHPVAEKMPAVRYRALIRTTFGYALYDVTEITKTRVYGRPVDRDEYIRAGLNEYLVAYTNIYVERSQMLTRKGTMAMLAQLIAIEKKRDRAHDAVNREHDAQIKSVIGKEEA